VSRRSAVHAFSSIAILSSTTCFQRSARFDGLLGVTLTGLTLAAPGGRIPVGQTASSPHRPTINGFLRTRMKLLFKRGLPAPSREGLGEDITPVHGESSWIRRRTRENPRVFATFCPARDSYTQLCCTGQGVRSEYSLKSGRPIPRASPMSYDRWGLGARRLTAPPLFAQQAFPDRKFLEQEWR
jgi:hypothetical protein